MLFQADAEGEFAEATNASELRDVHYGNTSPLEKLDDEDIKDVVIENAVLLRKSRQKERRRQRQRLFSSNWLL
jgi:hypothetical protein